MKNLGPLQFPRMPTPAEERALIESEIHQAEQEKAPYLSLAMMKELPAWKEVRAGLQDGLSACVNKMAKASGEEVYRYQGEYRVWARLTLTPERASQEVRSLDMRLAGLRERLGQLPKS